MSVRVIGGIYGGRKLDTPPGEKTHPMGERIRNALFNSIGGILPGAEVLDAFAGTGALGIEAVSRGAGRVTFVEKDRIAQKCIQNNISILGIQQAKLVKATVSGWLDTYKGDGFDIIFADPPYHDTQLAAVKKLGKVLRPGGTLILSWPESEPAPHVDDVLTPSFDRVYAGARIVMYNFVK